MPCARYLGAKQMGWIAQPTTVTNEVSKYTSVCGVENITAHTGCGSELHSSDLEKPLLGCSKSLL